MPKKVNTPKPAAKTPKVVKAIEKPTKKAAPKKAEATKKTVAPKKTAAAKKTKDATTVDTKTGESKKVLEVCLLLDCTGSMGSWIDRSKDTLAQILTNIKDGYPDLEVRAGFVGYRDIGESNRFSVMTFTDDLPKIT